jgi:lysophospholipase L1-like esterase
MVRRAALWLFALVLTALLIEGGARLVLAVIGSGDAPIAFGWEGDMARTAAVRNLIYVPDPIVFFRLSPNLDVETTSNPRFFDVRTDSRGMRNPEPALPKPPGTYRVLAVGDSCTFGSGAGQSGTYPTQLEQHLNRARSEPRFDVLNAGVPGFTSFQALGLLEIEGFALSPDAVIFASGFNDATSATAGGWRPFVGDGMLSDTEYAEAIRRSRTLGITWLLWRAGLWVDGARERIEDPPGAKRRRVSVLEYGANLRAFVDSSRSHGTTPVLVVWPRRSQIDMSPGHEKADRLMARYHDEVRRVARTTSTTVVDLTETLHGREDLFIDMIHLNAQGYGLVANSVAGAVLADVDQRARHGAISLSPPLPRD